MAKGSKQAETVTRTDEAVTETVETVSAGNAVTVQDTATDAASEPESEVGEGFRARRAFMPKLLLPNKDWVMQNVLAKGAGTKVTIGRVYGQCMEAKEKTQALPDGKPSTTIVLIGAFEAMNYITGEMMSVSNAYLPMAYAERVAAAFKDETIKVVEIDCDIGLEATGKTIPYEWVVTAYLEGAEMQRLKKMRTLRGRPTNAPPLLTAPKG